MTNTIKFNTKAELAKALLDGRTFLTADGYKLYYEEKNVSFNLPFLVKDKHGVIAALNPIWVNLLAQDLTELLPEHPHQALMDLAKANPRMRWFYKKPDSKTWQDAWRENPAWDIDNEYRPHPHWQLIIDAEDNPGQEWEFKAPGDSEYTSTKFPTFYEEYEYRKKQATEFRYQYIGKTLGGKWQVYANMLTEEEASVKFKGRYYDKTGLTIEVPIE
jgi:hypothetical protein